MGELRAARHVADRKGAAVGGAQSRIDGDPFCGRFDPRRGQIEPLYGRAPPGRDQQMRPRDPLAIGEPGDDAVSVEFDSGDLDSWTDRYSFALQELAEAGDELGIGARPHRPDVE